MAELVYLKYRDHVLFKNMDSSTVVPAERETIGWIIKENDQALWVVSDRPSKNLPKLEKHVEESGLVILKTDILEMRSLD